MASFCLKLSPVYERFQLLRQIDGGFAGIQLRFGDPIKAVLHVLRRLQRTRSGWAAQLAADDDQPGTSDDSAGSGYYVLRNNKGQRTGTLEEEGAGYMVQRNTKGERTGTWELAPTGDQWIIRDTAGRRVGTVDRR